MATTYRVAAGDTLSGIAQRFYGNANLYPAIAAANGIADPQIISVGQTLVIPDGHHVYTVVAGDTLSAIAQRFYGNANLYPGIANANVIPNPDLINIGQVLYIPDQPRTPPTPVPPTPPHPCPPQQQPPSYLPPTVNVTVSCCECSTGRTDHPDGEPPGRPVHHTGTSDGSITGGIGTAGGLFNIPTRPTTVWPGPRTDLFLPFLMVRANAGDTAARPISGVFWESPDIFVLPEVAPDAAPPVPPKLGGVAEAGKDNTIYAHVWNLGQAPAYQVVVEFWWFNPTLGFSDGDANLIGWTVTMLNARSQRGCHKVVKCPTSWKAQFLNGGHECLVVRIYDKATDPLSDPRWDAARNRHVAQRNIHVMSAAEAAAKPTLGVNVGPLFAAPAQLAVARADTTTMPWLHLVTMSRTTTLGTAAPTGDVGITQPVPAGAPLPTLGAIPNPRGTGLIGNGGGVAGDGQKVGFVATDTNPGAGNAHVYRVTGAQNGQVFGGYTVVVVGD
jgi:LysM repeat protein